MEGCHRKGKEGLSTVGLLSYGKSVSKHYKKGDYKEWTDSKGRKRTSKELEKQANGKYKKGVQGIRNSEKFARDAAAPWKTAGKLLGRGIAAYDGIQLIKDPCRENMGTFVFSVAGAMSTEIGLLILFAETRMQQHERAAEKFKRARSQQY